MTTRIELYHAARATADRVAQAVRLTLGRDSPVNRGRFWCAFDGIQDERWMKFIVDAAHGYNGEDITNASDELGHYLARAIQKHHARLLDTAAALAHADAEKARAASDEEARGVLRERVT